jgi:hypothetical protein
LNKNNKINTESYVEKTGKYGQLIKNKIEPKHIWKISEESINEFPEFSFDPIYSKDGKFTFGTPVPCPIDCAIITLIVCVPEDGCLECPVNGFIKASCDAVITAEVESNPYNKKVFININNSGEVAHVKAGSYVKIDVSIGENKENSNDLVIRRLEKLGVEGVPENCPCSLACCECVLFGAIDPFKNIKNKIIYRTNNLQNDRKKVYFNKEHIIRNVSERLKRTKKR